MELDPVAAISFVGEVLCSGSDSRGGDGDGDGDVEAVAQRGPPVTLVNRRRRRCFPSLAAPLSRSG